MRPSARIAAFIELIELIEGGIANSAAPADSIVNTYFRERRYAGSKDRRTVSEWVYGYLRSRAYHMWALASIEAELSARNTVLSYLAANAADMLPLFGEEGGYGPDALEEDEVDLVEKLQTLGEAPAEVVANIPEWAQGGFKDRFGKQMLEAAEALNTAAPLDLRLNSLKAKHDLNDYLNLLPEGAAKTPYSPIGLRSAKKPNLAGMKEYKAGEVEVQDEAAQIASLMVGAEPGMQVLDICAGAGGKALTVAGQMKNKGQLYAFDISKKRMRECEKRLERAGSRNVQTKLLDMDAESREAAFEPYKATCDRVYVDVPCTGTGTWRRSPDQRWRFTSEALTELYATQLGLLKEAAPLVKTGGRLIYMTCSVLPQENERILTRFMNQQPEWKLVDYKSVWAEVLGDAECPNSLSSIEECLQLAPHKHGTDGFFIAIMEK